MFSRPVLALMIVLGVATTAGRARAEEDEDDEARSPADAALPAPITPPTPPEMRDVVPITPAPATPRMPEKAEDEEPEIDYTTPRYEPAGFPLIAGDSDIGLQLGAAGTLTRFRNGVRPFYWNMDAVVGISVKSGPKGWEIAQQFFRWQWDVPGLWDGKWRTNPYVSYARTINAGYFGVGNDSDGAPPVGSSGDTTKFFQWENKELRLRVINRFALGKSVDFVVAPVLQYVAPTAYAGSRLDLDAKQPNNINGSPSVRGLQELALATASVGFLYDSRDNEFFPQNGGYHQAALKYIQGFPVDSEVRYGAASAVFAAYKSVGPFVLAGRLLVDFLFGHVPFYELISGGPFISVDMLGGSNGVRGVPQGRYNGRAKAVANVEIRSMFARFKLLGFPFKMGANTFFDTGRVWAEYRFNAPRDGTGLGLKWGAGGGIYLQWGDAAIFRIEAAYSPDAAAVSPGFPVGVYVSDQVMF